MQHLLAFTKSMTAGSTNQAISAVNDGQITINGNGNPIFDRPIYVNGIYVQGATLTRARLNTPPLRTVALPRISPFQVGTTPGDLPPFTLWSSNPPVIPTANEIAIETSNGAGADERHWALLFVSDAHIVPASGQVIPLFATGTTTLVANVWTAVPLTFEQTLPGGWFEVVGMRVLSTTAIGARLLFPSGGWRPGVLCSASESQDDYGRFRSGKWGSFGFFNAFSPPQVEIFATAADTAQAVYLDVIKRRDS